MIEEEGEATLWQNKKHIYRATNMLPKLANKHLPSVLFVDEFEEFARKV